LFQIMRIIVNGYRLFRFWNRLADITGRSEARA
jgi:hypothetical protein